MYFHLYFTQKKLASALVADCTLSRLQSRSPGLLAPACFLYPRPSINCIFQFISYPLSTPLHTSWCVVSSVHIAVRLGRPAPQLEAGEFWGLMSDCAHKPPFAEAFPPGYSLILLLSSLSSGSVLYFRKLWNFGCMVTVMEVSGSPGLGCQWDYKLNKTRSILDKQNPYSSSKSTCLSLMKTGLPEQTSSVSL